MLNFVQEEGNSLQLTPGGGFGGAFGHGGDARVLAAGGPDFFGLRHAVVEIGVDFGDFSGADHGGKWSVG